MAAARKQPTRKKPRLSFAGISLEIPAKLPASFSMDLVEIGADADTEAEATFRAVTSVIGKDGWRKVRDAHEKKPSGNGGADVIGDLLEAIMKIYGVDEGK